MGDVLNVFKSVPSDEQHKISIVWRSLSIPPVRIQSELLGGCPFTYYFAHPLFSIGPIAKILIRGSANVLHKSNLEKLHIALHYVHPHRGGTSISPSALSNPSAIAFPFHRIKAMLFVVLIRIRFPPIFYLSLIDFGI